jgi:2-polyprenyl-3-methyl-5-hydroxy-6-metoxy-1,4-benzoquinol methylase
LKDEYLQIHYYRLNLILNQINSLNLNSSAKILDVGCYPPHIFNSLAKLGYDTYGISSLHEKVKNPKISVLNVETQKFPYPKNFFDLVIFSEILEHLSANPQPVFDQIYNVLKPGGFLIITTPNAVRLHNLVKIIFGKNIYFPIYQLKQSLYHRHHREYVQNEVKVFLLNSSFKIKTLKNITAYPPFRPKNQKDSVFLKIIKWTGYCLMLLFPVRKDTIFVLASRS